MSRGAPPCYRGCSVDRGQHSSSLGRFVRQRLTKTCYKIKGDGLVGAAFWSHIAVPCIRAAGFTDFSDVCSVQEDAARSKFLQIAKESSNVADICGKLRTFCAFGPVNDGDIIPTVKTSISHVKVLADFELHNDDPDIIDQAKRHVDDIASCANVLNAFPGGRELLDALLFS